MSGLFHRIFQWRLARYMVASFAGTIVDLGGFLLLYANGMAPVGAATASYILGVAIHWIVSSRFVFADRLARPGMARGAQQVLFVLSALAGLAITAGIVWFAGEAEVDPRIGKLVAMGASFLAVWTIRLLFVFRPD
ncbi:GtrA family protein [Qipengyuania nanhaisediminis]|nr:GtrA family protein [Qipengyuania nanhaisediminis]